MGDVLIGNWKWEISKMGKEKILTDIDISVVGNQFYLLCMWHEKSPLIMIYLDTSLMHLANGHKHEYLQSYCEGNQELLVQFLYS